MLILPSDFLFLDFATSSHFYSPPPYASRHACSRVDATLFWTCIKIAKALKDFHGKD